MLIKTRTLIVLVSLVFLGRSAADAQDFAIDWWTVDGGGGISAGGDLELAGTIGQPDAGTTVMSGGNFELIGGYWPITYACPGDCNCDGSVDFLDINVFVAILGGQAPCWFANADINGDGAIDFDDINPFVAVLSGGGGPCS